MANDEQLKNKVYLIKFICSILVIFDHAYNIEIYGIDKNASFLSYCIYYLENFEILFTTLAVAMFFFISGFLFFNNMEEKSIWKKLVKRSKSVLLTYIIWSTIYYIYFCVVTNLPFSSGITSLNYYSFSLKSWINFLLINEKLIPLWFMETLIIILLFTPLINIVLKNKPLCILLIALLIIFNATPYKDYCIGIYDTNYLLYFIIGSFFSKNRIISCSKKISIFSLLLLILFPLSLIVSARKYFFIIIIIEIICSWFCADLFKINIKWWMKETTFSFVFHVIPLEIIEKIILILFGINPIFALIDYLIAPLISFIICIFLAKLLKRYFTNLYHILI